MDATGQAGTSKGETGKSAWRLLEKEQDVFTLEVRVQSERRPRVSYLWSGEVSINNSGAACIGGMHITGIDEDDEEEPGSWETGITQHEHSAYIGAGLGAYPSRQDDMFPPMEENIRWMAELCLRRSREMEEQSLRIEKSKLEEAEKRSQAAQALRRIAGEGAHRFEALPAEQQA